MVGELIIEQSATTIACYILGVMGSIMVFIGGGEDK
jgi:hypothetical protein